MAVLGGLVVFTILAPAAEAEEYEVQPGDTLSGIAVRFGISTGVLLTLNPDVSSPDLLSVGQRLTIPDNATAAPAPVPTPAPTAATHTVQPGETLSGIAAFYATTVDDLLKLNPHLERVLLLAGSVLIVDADLSANQPAAGDGSGDSGGPTGSSGRLAGEDVVPYRVLPGDTYIGLAERFGTTPSRLLTLNPAVPPNRLLAGSVIFVPRVGVEIASPTPPPSQQQTRPYVVVPGDNATIVALGHGVSLDQLRAANPGIDLSVILVGQTLQIPAVSAAPTPFTPPGSAENPAELTIYVVRPGDNATEIAARHKLTLDQLAALNPSFNLNLLLIGQELVVPLVDLPPPPPGTVPAGPPPPLAYTVAPGDTLTAIAQRFEVALPILQRLNPDVDPDLLSVGQELHVPGTVPIPVVSRTLVTDFGDTIQYVAARLGVLPHTLIANNPFLADRQFISAGTELLVPDREGIVVRVRAGDTLAAIAVIHGTSIDAILADPGNGVADSNQLIAGQELIIPISVPAFIWPATGSITDGFGVCRTGDCSVRHGGVDISQHTTPGRPILSIASGEVTFAGGTFCCGLGFYVEVDHGNGWVSRYAHLSGPPPVSVGQRVDQGETLGFSGSTGFSTGVHLHLELEHNGWALDALNYLP